MIPSFNRLAPIHVRRHRFEENEEIIVLNDTPDKKANFYSAWIP